MATGVEMLGQMSEDMQLAGPVQGGNMVVKPNEAPVGAAAMLSKALRKEANKGVAGIYELPTPKEPLPDFMKEAQRVVSQQESAQRNMYPNNFADDEGGILMLPRNLRTAPGVPETSLAYITDEEKAILGLLKPGTPHKGPEDVPSYDSLDYVAADKPMTSTSGDQGTSQSVFDTVSQGGGTQEQQQQVKEFFGTQAGQAVQKQLEMEEQQETNPFAQTGQSVADIVSDVRTGVRDKDDKSEGNLLSKLDAKEREENEKNMKSKSMLEKQIEEEKKLIAEGKGDKERLKNLQKRLDKTTKLLNQQPSLFEGLLDEGSKAKDSVIKKLKELGLIGPEIKAIEDLPEKTQEDMFKLLNEFERVKVSPKEAMSPLMTTIKGIGAGLEREDGSMTLQGLTKALRALDTGDGASVLETLKKYAPDKYFKAFGEAQTSGGLADFAMNKTIDTSGMDRNSQEYKDAKKYNNAIFDARQKTQDDRSKNRPSGFSRPVVIDEEDVTEQIVEADDMTMPYKGPRTGDVEKDVPLSRRFKTDPTKDVAQFTTTPRTQEDIYKYMTQGTTGEGITLEPFSEYQRRRRKALGLDPLELYG
jgi:hypothetical protein